MVTDTLAPMGAASFFFKEKPLDCARGDKKKIERTAGNSFSLRQASV